MNKECSVKEERKEKNVGRRTKFTGKGGEVEGRERAENERKGREVEIGGRRKGRRDDRENNVPTS